MAVCYLFANYEVQYKCKYNITKDFIEVETDYDIEEEIEAENGLKLLGSHTQFKERDILIIDYQNKSNFLLKNARYVGRSSVYGTPDGGRKTKFRTRNYFRHGDYGKMGKICSMFFAFIENICFYLAFPPVPQFRCFGPFVMVKQFPFRSQADHIILLLYSPSQQKNGSGKRH